MSVPGQSASRASPEAALQSVDVTISTGVIRGVQNDDVSLFRGVRYAEPCSTTTRFNAPRPLSAHQPLQDARQFGHLPIQPARTSAELIQILGRLDCLTLNIWTPGDGYCGADLPVMVWLPGGGFIRCDASDPLYDGTHFARQGIIFVTVNYRVGVEGFLHLPGMDANRGLQDQILALEWIQQNVSYFGGDPARVTVFGGSAGAGSVVCLMGMSNAAGLFHQVILQSPSVLVQTPDEAAKAAFAIADLAGCPATHEGFVSTPPEHAAQALATLSMKAELRKRYGLGTHHRFPLRPVVDGQVLACSPINAIARNQRLPDAVLTGANEDEARLYMVPNGSIHQVTASDLAAFVKDAGLPADTVQRYRQRLPPARRSDGEVMCAIQSDYYYRMPAREISELIAAQGCTSYAYEFCWRSTLYGGALGAAHGVETPFVFKNLDNEMARNFVDVEAEPPVALAEVMHRAWVSFAKHGNPGWRAQTVDEKVVMRFDDKPLQTVCLRAD